MPLPRLRFSQPQAFQSLPAAVRSELHTHLPSAEHMQSHYHSLQKLLFSHQLQPEGLQIQLHTPASSPPALLFPAGIYFQAVLPDRLYLHTFQGSVCHSHTSSVYTQPW